MPTLFVRQLSKTYPNGVKALHDINLNIEQGIFGLLGQNGAGKSTLMRTLATLQSPDCGEIKLDDLNMLREPLTARRQIGYLPQDMGVYPLMSAFETLAYFAGLKGLSHTIDVLHELEKVNLADVADQRLDTFSGGMRRRFGIAVAFLGAPKLVIVDEPTAGLDPFERRRFQQLLVDAARDCILLLSTHIIDDIEDLATQMGILHEGRIIACGAPDHLIEQLRGCVWTCTIKRHDLPYWQHHPQLLSWRPRKDKLLIRLYSQHRPGEAFVAAEPDVEDCYTYHLIDPS